MKISVPVYVQTQPSPGKGRKRYVARPLFFHRPGVASELIDRALNKLADLLREQLRSLAGESRHDELTQWSFCPAFEQHHVRLVLDLRDELVRCRPLIVAFESFGNRVGVWPESPDRWFQITAGQTVAESANKALERILRDQRKGVGPAGERRIDLDQLRAQQQTWATVVDLEIPIPKMRMPERFDPLALLGGPSDSMDGEEELHKVGHCLDRLYPDQLMRAAGHLEEPASKRGLAPSSSEHPHRILAPLSRQSPAELAAELADLLNRKERKGILLVGKRGTGKTTIIHETVRLLMQRSGQRADRRHQTWLLAPARLISGMSYVGQWQNRLVAILRQAAKWDHILYFDDLLGLYQAGRSSESDLCIAHVLKPYILRGEVRLLGEITPEALRVLKERDRGLADGLHVLPVEEPTESQALPILIAIQRQLEADHDCRFNWRALPVAMELQRRYQTEAALPGSVASLLQQLAARAAGEEIDAQRVLEDFHERSGLPRSFVFADEKLSREAILDGLRQGVIGQSAALDALASAIAVAKARLNDPGRPLASFLFVGPTGVGKTQCAKALARYLFGNEDRLLRFDMNEYLTTSAATELIGSYFRPDGQLTSALRRQPFSVLLLDEIEKAHGSVHDLLLQVLGEGRLTDALGRVVDFTNAIIILTSNLGARQVAAQFGFCNESGNQQQIYLRAAEQFFRPELFNRLDQVVPFTALSREDFQQIARRLIGQVLKREGLARRALVVRVEEQATEAIVEKGLSSQYGARSLQRAIEDQLTRPLARHVAAASDSPAAVLSVFRVGTSIVPHFQPLQEDERRRRDEPVVRVARTDPQQLATSFLQSIRSLVQTHCPADATPESLEGAITPERLRRLVFRECAERVSEPLRQLLEHAGPHEQARHPEMSSISVPPPRRPYRLIRDGWPSRLEGRDKESWRDLRDYLQELAATAEPLTDRAAQRLINLGGQTLLLSMMAQTLDHDHADRAIVLYGRPGEAPMARTTDEDEEPLLLTAKLHQQFFQGIWSHDAALETLEDTKTCALVVEGPNAVALAEYEASTHLHLVDGHLEPVLMRVEALPRSVDAQAILQRDFDQRRRWQEDVARGRVAPDDDPWSFPPVLRVYGRWGWSVDYRTGMMVRGAPSPEDLRSFIFAGLLATVGPLPGWLPEDEEDLR